MDFKQFYEDSMNTMADFQRFVQDKFVGDLAGQESDFYQYMGNRGYGKDTFKYQGLAHVFQDWLKSKKRAEFALPRH